MHTEVPQLSGHPQKYLQSAMEDVPDIQGVQRSTYCIVPNGDDDGDFVDDLDDHDPLTQHPGTETAVCLMFMSRRGCVQNSTHLVIYNAKKRAILCAVIVFVYIILPNL